ncbi:pkinase-domain-containing protein [Phaffia rhodozyma]|uniref:Serine/threonine-protein kinase n=1 Tax=Phaffia rhodozyma TaxID=264483 RepID=A0A0F7SFU1_PHARH|nr:pkinase-domain-containing protein [Phaffia rhodozyma]
MPSDPPQPIPTAAPVARAPAPPKKDKKDRIPSTPPPIIRDHVRKIEFQRIGLLGEGGFARVYEVRTGEGNHLAFKVVSKKSLQTTKTKTKLYAEIKIHKMLDHPNIVSFKECFDDQDNVYMSLELCERGSMMDLLRARKGLTEPEVRNYLVQLVGACSYMHSQNIIHRDLKLGNIFLDARMDVKVGDFGLAALIEKEGERKKTICGTPNYIAPEVLFDTANGHSFEVDIWSIGVILYTLIIGKPPFQTKEIKAIYKRIRDNQYDFPPDKPISENAQDLIRNILTIDPRKRPTLSEVLNHSFFTSGAFPSSLPASSHDAPPNFTHLTPQQSAYNFTKVKNRAMQIKPLGVPSRTMATLGPSVAQQEREFQRAVQPDSPLSHLLSSACQPLLVSNEPRSHKEPSLLSKLTSAAGRPSAHSGLPSISKATSPTSHRVSSSSTRENQPSAPTPQIVNISTKSASTGYPPSRPSTAATAAAAVAANPDYRRSSGSSTRAQSEVFSEKALPPTGHLEPSSTASTKKSGGMFDVVSQNLADALEARDAGRPFHTPHIPAMPSDPKVFIVSWLDYCNKYGMGYALTDGSVGVHFNDSTSLVLAPDKEHFDYISSHNKQQQRSSILVRRNYTLTTFPEELTTKIYLLKHFQGFMQERLYNEKPYCFLDEAKVKGMDFVQRYLRMKHVIVFKLSHDVLQFNFYDHTKLVLSYKGLVVTYINKDYKLQTWSIEKLLRPDLVGDDKKTVDSVIKKLRYVRVLLTTIKTTASNVGDSQQEQRHSREDLKAESTGVAGLRTVQPSIR